SVVVVDLDQDAARAAPGELFRADVTDPEQLAAAIAHAEDAHGGLDVVHLNAGIGLDVSDATAVTDEQYRAIMGVNVDHVVHGTRHAAAAMERHGGGSVVVTASLAGLVPFPDDPFYTLTKHAVVGWVRAAAPGLAPKGVRINCVCPGFADTPMVRGEARRRFEEAGFPLLGPEEVAAAALVAATDAGSGQAFVCQPGRPVEAYRFRGVPGPRSEGAGGMAPPRPKEAEGRGEG
ncbi:MAG: SDR family NAD(P)-dependent oxidoreductase, partial [Actinomycetota bacterium]